MLQLRITQKFAKDLKLKKLPNPNPVDSILDDWVIDLIRVQRRKVAMVTHVKTLMTFYIPYKDVGGVNNVPEAIGVKLSQWLCKHGFSDLGEQALKLFQEKPFFCKTDHRKVLGHMNEFKWCIGWCMEDMSFDQIDWQDILDRILYMPVKTIGSGFSMPAELMFELLGDKAKFEYYYKMASERISKKVKEREKFHRRKYVLISSGYGESLAKHNITWH